jgi:HEAT repeat protein
MESLLIHELVHLKRRDPWVDFVQLVMETVCFFNPAVWIISSNLRRQREFCCDDTMLQLGHISAVDYADALVTVAEASLASRTMPVTLIGAVARRVSELSLRIDRILGTHALGRSIFPGQAFAAFAVVVLLIGGILTAALQTPQPPKDASSQAAPASIASTDQSSPKTESERDRLLRLTKDSDAYIRRRAVSELHQNPDLSLVPPMIDLLEDSDSTVRVGAASLLSDVSDNRAVEPLIKALVNAQNQWEATAIINALAATKDPRAIDPIVAAFKQYPDLDGNSIRAVANFDDDRIRDALFARVSEAEVPSFSLVNILVTMNDRRLIPRMLQLLEAPNRYRRNAIQVLGQLKAVEAVPELQRLVVGKEKEDRESASYALGRIGDPTSIPNLMLALKSEPDDEALKAHCWAIGELGEVQALPRLEELQTHKSQRVTRAAKDAIAAIRLGANLKRREAGDEAGLATAIDGLKSPAESIVISAIEYVRHHHEDRRTEILGHLCADQRNDVRSNAIQALLTDDSQAAVEFLASALSVSDSADSAVLALAQRRDARAWPAILKMMHSDDVDVQRSAAENLHYFGKDALPILRDMLANDDEKLRRAALTSLQEIADVSVLDVLLKYAVEETRSSEKSRIIDTLGRIDDPRSIQYLETLLDDPRQTHAHDAVRALIRLGWKPRTEEQRIRYLVVSGQRDSNSIPRTQGNEQTQSGEFILNIPIQTALKAGTAEHPVIYRVGSIEFRNDGNNVTGLAKGYSTSWPKLAFRLTVRLLGSDDLLIAERTADVATSGIIITVAVSGTDDIELDFGGINPADVRRFEVNISTIIDPLPPGVSVSSHVDRDFTLNENIPLKLSASRGEAQPVFSCESVKFSEGEPDAWKRRVINAEFH